VGVNRSHQMGKYNGKTVEGAAGKREGEGGTADRGIFTEVEVLKSYLLLRLG
jgi:hypothetical protein